MIRRSFVLICLFFVYVTTVIGQDLREDRGVRPGGSQQEIVVGDYHAFIFYVNDYQNDRLDLRYPDDDAKKLYEVLHERYRFKTIEIIANPDRSRLLSRMNSLKDIPANDNILIFFAGHGSYSPDIGQGYWLPRDGEFADLTNKISNSDIRDMIKGIRAKHVLLVSDACFSGSIFSSRNANRGDGSLKSLYPYTSRNAMTSGVLEEVPDNSAFLHYLVERLSSNDAPYLGALDLFVSFRDAVTNNSNTSPQYGAIQNAGDEGGEFFFILKDAVLPSLSISSNPSTLPDSTKGTSSNSAILTVLNKQIHYILIFVVGLAMVVWGIKTRVLFKPVAYSLLLMMVVIFIFWIINLFT